MNIIVAGGTGLIGGAFVRELAQRGHGVTVLSRSGGGGKTSTGATVYGWDARTAAGWGELMEEADVVVNLAGANLGASRWTEQRKREVLNSRLQAGEAIRAGFDQASRKPSLLIQASAVGYYGTNLDDTLKVEDAPAGKDYLAGVVVDWEKTAQPVAEKGVRVITIRTGLVLSKSDGALQRMLLPFRLFAGGPLGSGRQWYAWIHLKDQVNAMVHLLEKEDTQGIYNLCAPNPVKMKDFGRTLARVMHRPYWFPAPAFALHLLLGEMSTLVLGGQRAVPQRLVESGYSFQFPHLEPALRDLLKG